MRLFLWLFCLCFSLSLITASPTLAQNDSQLRLNQAVQGQLTIAGQTRRLPQLVPAGSQSFASNELPELIKCNGSCLCKGAADCVNMVYSGCCGGSVTCDDSGCSCVNAAGCDADGHLPD